ncbi:hypothetical protein P692DRAFT_201599116, partial [Suillus brevipes Sb2]
SPALSPCWEFSKTVPSSLAHPPSVPRKTSSGGKRPLAHHTHLEPSLVSASSTNSMLIRTLALVTGSASSSTRDGEPGTSSQDGKETAGTLDGRKASVLNSSSSQSSGHVPPAFILRYTETIAESSKGGGQAAAEAKPATKFSSAYTLPLMKPNAQSSPDMSLARTTPQTAPPAAYIPPHARCFHQFLSPTSSVPSLQTSPVAAPTRRHSAPNQHTNRFTQWSKSTSQKSSSAVPSSIANLSAAEKNSSKRRKTTYSPSLTPLPSSLRPQCPARERLYLWTPTTSRSPKDAQGNRLPLSQAEVEKIRDTMVHAFADSTRETYGSGLLVFHVFCDSKSIPEDQRAPASRILISSFITEMAGHYSGKTVSNYVHGIRTWHILHGVPWSLGGDIEIDTLFKAAISLTPSSSKKPNAILTPFH